MGIRSHTETLRCFSLFIIILTIGIAVLIYPYKDNKCTSDSNSTMISAICTALEANQGACEGNELYSGTAYVDLTITKYQVDLVCNGNGIF
mmetsp:Transcript_32730/g.29612  ORF Transcript_32730/g.29612 Transcript_32730/m.29612 type:complete len:91 (-) Transcript_32730:2269-2541(-)